MFHRKIAAIYYSILNLDQFLTKTFILTMITTDEVSVLSFSFLLLYIAKSMD
jgi:hypothetical protein